MPNFQHNFSISSTVTSLVMEGFAGGEECKQICDCSKEALSNPIFKSSSEFYSIRPKVLNALNADR